jgi:hypothetical protein
MNKAERKFIMPDIKEEAPVFPAFPAPVFPGATAPAFPDGQN